jgi:hypothetical protein
MKKLSIKNVKKLSRVEMKQIMAGSGGGTCGQPCNRIGGCGAGGSPCWVCVYPNVCGTN